MNTGSNMNITSPRRSAAKSLPGSNMNYAPVYSTTDLVTESPDALEEHLGLLYESFAATGNKMAELRRRGVLIDLTIVIGNTQFPVHKLVLASCPGNYFSGLILGSFIESRQNQIVMKDVDSDTFKILLDFIYADKASRSHRIIDYFTVMRIVKLARRFDFPLANLDRILELIDVPSSMITQFVVDITEIHGEFPMDMIDVVASKIKIDEYIDLDDLRDDFITLLFKSTKYINEPFITFRMVHDLVKKGHDPELYNVVDYPDMTPEQLAIVRDLVPNLNLGKFKSTELTPNLGKFINSQLGLPNQEPFVADVLYPYKGRDSTYIYLQGGETKDKYIFHFSGPNPKEGTRVRVTKYAMGSGAFLADNWEYVDRGIKSTPSNAAIIPNNILNFIAGGVASQTPFMADVVAKPTSRVIRLRGADGSTADVQVNGFIAVPSVPSRIRVTSYQEPMEGIYEINQWDYVN